MLRLIVVLYQGGDDQTFLSCLLMIETPILRYTYFEFVLNVAGMTNIFFKLMHYRTSPVSKGALHSLKTDTMNNQAQDNLTTSMAQW